MYFAPFRQLPASKVQQSRKKGGTMATSEEMKIVLQVGTELRVTNKGQVVVSNPELELAREDRAADATLLYRFDANRGEHIFRLATPVADHKHMKVHRAND
jgi:hypothetical protein